MYLVLNSSNLIVDITSYAHYVRKQRNDVTVVCNQAEADAIYSANTDKFYPLEKTGYISDSYNLAEVFMLPPEVISGYYYFYSGEFYTSAELQAKLTQAKALEDMGEIIIDQEYRLTLLELGVTQDVI